MAAGGSDWSSLPGELLEQISGHLSTDADNLHIHQVCAHWRACTSPVAAFRPWILARRTARSRPPAPPAYHYFVWPPRGHLQREVEDIVAPPAGFPYCRGSSRGWLALADGGSSPTRLVLWDPASGAEIRLPPLDGVIQVFLSADPLASPDWVAVASQSYGNNIGAQKSFFCRPGDAAWSALCDRPTAGIESVAFHGGRVYCLDWMGVLVGCDLNNPGAAPAQIISTSGPVSRLCSCSRYHGVRGGHVVSCAGDLLLVVVRNSGHPSFAEIYKLESPPEPGRRMELGVRVTDLGDYSLFLAPGESFALSAKEFPAIKRNHVYGLVLYGNYSRSHGRTWPDWAFVFDLGSDTLKRIPYPKELRNNRSNLQPLFWFCLRGPFMKKQQHLTEK